MLNSQQHDLTEFASADCIVQLRCQRVSGQMLHGSEPDSIVVVSQGQFVNKRRSLTGLRDKSQRTTIDGQLFGTGLNAVGIASDDCHVGGRVDQQFFPRLQNSNTAILPTSAELEYRAQPQGARRVILLATQRRW